ncbi:hypothetical protein SCORR_v1c04080 [Spiroplasma corruscae]|uniref:Lipoprotein n=1 Tax=Spiroplasma corruscae TaxID=216934 RepID=A0A222ENW2_9MOLU|nr:lipoprotein [Spiroplasma corruscae]ASP28182.1 hypothetical protein SCORR_v1c04080 [Spiroplasma corruscae]
MKKILTFLAATGIVASTASTVVSCDDDFGYKVDSNLVVSSKDELIGYDDQIALFFIIPNSLYLQKLLTFEVKATMYVNDLSTTAVNYFKLENISKNNSDDHIYSANLVLNFSSNDEKPSNETKYELVFNIKDDTTTFGNFTITYKDKTV